MGVTTITVAGTAVTIGDIVPKTIPTLTTGNTTAAIIITIQPIL